MGDATKELFKAFEKAGVGKNAATCINNVINGNFDSFIVRETISKLDAKAGDSIAISDIRKARNEILGVKNDR